MGFPIKVDKKIVLRDPEIFDVLENKFTQKAVTYIVDSKFRKAVHLKDWLLYQLLGPSSEVMAIVEKLKSDNPDTTVLNCLRWVQKNIVYVGDKTTWSMSERWQTADETLIRWYVRKNGKIEYLGAFVEQPQKDAFRAGDCEDGAVLIYVLARLAGVSEKQLCLMAGNVMNPKDGNDAGHCWLAYKPLEYPMNWVYLDWCYYYDYASIANRSLFYVYDKKIEEYSWDRAGRWKVKSCYRTLWFAFNESASFVSLVNKNI